MSDEIVNEQAGETAAEPSATELGENPTRADLKAAADAFLKANKDAPAPETTDSELDDAPVELTADQQILALEIEKEDLRDQLLRTLAEMENLRKRSEREKSEVRTFAIEKFARDLLNVSDNLARALESLPEAERAALTEGGKGLLGGIEMTHKELHTVLTRHGVTEIAAEPGALFDPNLHQAVANIPSEHPNGTIASLFQGGWRIGARTLRAAMVAVSAGGVTPSSEA